MSCESCKEKSTIPAPVPYIVFEAAQARNERAIKHLVVALIVALVMIFVSNACWLWAWMQYDYTSEQSSVEVDASDGIANYIGGMGDITNGADSG